MQQGYAQLQLLAGGHFAPQLVREVFEEDDLDLCLLGFRPLGRHERHEALAVGRNADIPLPAEVRELGFRSQPPVGHKGIALHRICRHHDPMSILGLEKQLV